MDAITNAARELLLLVSPLWPIVWAAAFVVMLFESSRPKPVAGEEREPPSGWARLGMLAIAVLPFLLFVDAFGAFILANRDRGVLSGAEMLPVVVLLGVIAVLVLVPALFGNLIGRLAPALGTVLNRVAPLLGVAVLAFALYATWANVFMVLDLFVMSRLS